MRVLDLDRVSLYNEKVAEVAKDAIDYEIDTIVRKGKIVKICASTDKFANSMPLGYCCSIELESSAYILISKAALKSDPAVLRFMIEHEIGHIMLNHSDFLSYHYAQDPIQYYIDRENFSGDIARTEFEADIYAAKFVGVNTAVESLSAMYTSGLFNNTEIKARVQNIGTTITKTQCGIEISTSTSSAYHQYSGKSVTAITDPVLNIQVMDLRDHLSKSTVVDGWQGVAYLTANPDTNEINIHVTDEFYYYPDYTRDFILQYLVAQVECGQVNRVLNGETLDCVRVMEEANNHMLANWKPEAAIRALTPIKLLNHNINPDLDEEIKWFQDALADYEQFEKEEKEEDTPKQPETFESILEELDQHIVRKFAGPNCYTDIPISQAAQFSLLGRPDKESE